MLNNNDNNNNGDLLYYWSAPVRASNPISSSSIVVLNLEITESSLFFENIIIIIIILIIFNKEISMTYEKLLKTPQGVPRQGKQKRLLADDPHVINIKRKCNIYGGGGIALCACARIKRPPLPPSFSPLDVLYNTLGGAFCEYKRATLSIVAHIYRIYIFAIVASHPFIYLEAGFIVFI